MPPLPGPSPEHALLIESVQRYVSRDYPPLRQKAVQGRAGGVAEAWPTFAEMGWLAAALPEDLGGLGGGPLDLALIAEELGRGLVLEHYVAGIGVAAALLAETAPGALLDGSPLIEAIAAGSSRAALAADEAVTAEPMIAAPRREGFRLRGSRIAIEGGDVANAFLVPARLDATTGEEALFLVPAATAGAKVKPFRTVDDRMAAHLTLDVVVPGDALLARGAVARSALRAALDRQLILSSAEMVGALSAALDLTRDYLQTRRQFGRPIGDFQVLRHRLADMFIALEQARSMVLRGVTALEHADPAERTRVASAVKAKVAQSGRFVTGQAIQLHGGIGVTQEHLIGHFYKRLTAFDITGGSASDHVARFASLND